MRLIRLAILGLCAALQTAAAYGGAALSLKLTLLDPTPKPGEKIRIRVTITNESDHRISFNDRNPYCDYSVKVLTSAGGAAPQTAFKKQLPCGGGNGGVDISGRNILVTLKPGESTDWDMEITELFDVSVPGDYSVRVDRTFPDIGRVSSNTVTVTVVP